MNSGVQNPQPLSIDTGLSNTRSLPATPATTPPGNSVHGMQSYQSQSGYDNSKPYYSAAPPSQSPYAAQQPLAQPSMGAYGQPLHGSTYMKSEMGAPPGRASGGQSDTETADVKSAERYSQGNGQVTNGSGESVSEHESEYVHDTAYNATRGAYTYATNPSVGALAGEHGQLTPDITGSPSQQNGATRMTPRSSGGAPPQWASGYTTPPRSAASSLYNIVSDTRGTAASGGSADAYSVASNSTPAYSTGINGSLGAKRLRDDDEMDRSVRPDSRGTEYEHKRRKTLTDATMGGPVGGAPLALQPMAATGVMSRHR